MKQKFHLYSVSLQSVILVCFACCLTKFVFTQSRPYSLTLNAITQAGNCHIKWSTYQNHEPISYLLRKNQQQQGVGIGIQKNFGNQKALGLKYEYHAVIISDPIIKLFDRINEQQLFLYASHEDIPVLSRCNFIMRLSAGGNLMDARKIHPYMLRYTSPYDYNSKWMGYVIGFDMGVGFGFKNTNAIVQISTNLRFGANYLTSLERINDQKELEATGRIKYKVIGLELALVFGKSILPSYGGSD